MSLGISYEFREGVIYLGRSYEFLEQVMHSHNSFPKHITYSITFLDISGDPSHFTPLCSDKMHPSGH